MEHPIHQQITDILKQHDFWFEEFTHKAVRTSEEAAAIRNGYTIEQGAKALIIRAKIPNVGKKFVMLVMQGSKKFNGTKVKKILSSNDIRFATEGEVDEITSGVKPGGVPPFGNLFNLEVFADRSLFDNEKIVFNAGRTSTIGMFSADYIKIVQPHIEEIT
jgi:prolyl-tRNA editing enzyme YbaK/EbsC (Cys-tRNA(Pro) deacylase)